MKRPPKRPMDFLDWTATRTVPDYSLVRRVGPLLPVVMIALVVLAFVAAVALLSAPFLIWNTWIRHRTLGFQKEGHITDRLAKAVEQLGAEKTVKRVMRDAAGDPVNLDGKAQTEEVTVPDLEVRIGGLFSLERIAQDSVAYDGGRDHVQVIEIICAYIRTNAPASGAVDVSRLPQRSDAEDHRERAKSDFARSLHYASQAFASELDAIPEPHPDIYTAVLILGRRSVELRQIEASPRHTQFHGDNGLPGPCPALQVDQPLQPIPAAQIVSHAQDLAGWKEQISDYRGYRLDLRKTNLQCAEMAGLVFDFAVLDAARLEGAMMRGIRLGGAKIRFARLDAAQMDGACLDGAELLSCALPNVGLQNAGLMGANVFDCVFHMSNLINTDMSGASLSIVDLEQVRMQG